MHLDYKSVLRVAFMTAAATVLLGAADDKTDDREPIKVYARTIELDDRTGTAIYRGDVSMKDGTLSIKADTVKVRMDNGDIETFSALGKPVTIIHRPTDTDEEMHATADRLMYYVNSRKLDLFGNVTLRQGRSELRCPELHYDLEARRFVAKGNNPQQRCYIFLEPRKRSRSNSDGSTGSR